MLRDLPEGAPFDAAFPHLERRDIGAAVLRRYRQAPWSSRLFLQLRWRCTPYLFLARCLPPAGLLFDLGAGHGLLSLALVLTAPARQVVAVEPDHFRAGLVRRAAADLPQVVVWERPLQEVLPALAASACAAGIALVDVLHYLSAREQAVVLRQAGAALAPGGVLLVREVDAAAGPAAWATCAYERLRCRQALRGARLHFRSAAEWEALLRAQGLRVSSHPCPSLFFADWLFLGSKPGLQGAASWPVSVPLPDRPRCPDIVPGGAEESQDRALPTVPARPLPAGARSWPAPPRD
jgi:SAM-dependent methyltransferase